MADAFLLGLQLSEVEMLSSMFPKEEEFTLDNPAIVHEVREYVEGLSKGVPRQISFTLNTVIEEPFQNANIALICSLPHDYPNTTPEVFVRSSQFSRQYQKQINIDLNRFLSSLERGELCIAETLQWLQDNAKKYITIQLGEDNLQDKSSKCNDLKFTRLWIHSHHIYNKIKRKDIIEWAQELGLSGFSMPGKPGVICVEGYSSFCEEFWKRLRHLNWKKITMRHKEDIAMKTSDSESEFGKLKFFENFEEKNFDAHSFGHGRDYHMDLGLFYQFLEQHNCGYMFKILLGVDGKVSKS
ncbi:RWD domain-containing protein 2B-like [Saccoglossus kowalevskii]|uniref:RWD domain-containing protein 2B-like n=1 Tax=Saccoglossus kowalevskii TaxID=10224 RepID=A0ABM0GMV3_SACKO|nr:PREDICTED: RWD domain-containing protein 2B-like [Saccoglossus kowalevskii]